MGGIDEDGEAKMHWMDYLGTLQRVTKGGHGYAAYFVASVLDNAYKASITKDEGLVAIRACIAELKARFMMDQPSFIIKVITKDGIEIIE
jgi:20S proteasome subunit beta 4